MHYTEEEFNELKNRAEECFRTAVYSGWKRSTTYGLNKYVEDAYNRATGADIHRNLNCGVCVYNLYKDAGRLYFEDAAARAAMQKVVEEPEPSPKKPGRPKKNKDMATIA